VEAPPQPSLTRKGRTQCGLSFLAVETARSPQTRKGMERVKGIEPSSSAWKAVALPLSYTRAEIEENEIRSIISGSIRTGSCRTQAHGYPAWSPIRWNEFTTPPTAAIGGIAKRISGPAEAIKTAPVAEVLNRADVSGIVPRAGTISPPVCVRAP
jgi:hypothetical protein